MDLGLQCLADTLQLSQGERCNCCYDQSAEEEHDLVGMAGTTLVLAWGVVTTLYQPHHGIECCDVLGCWAVIREGGQYFLYYIHHRRIVKNFQRGVVGCTVDLTTLCISRLTFLNWYGYSFEASRFFLNIENQKLGEI